MTTSAVVAPETPPEHLGPRVSGNRPWLLAAAALPLAVWLGQAILAPPAAAGVLALGIASTLGVLLATAWACSALFARLRGQPLDPGWPLPPLLLLVLLPPLAPVVPAAVALAFGMVLGSLVYGGSARALVHPTLVAAVFLHSAWPGLVPDATGGLAQALACLPAAVLLLRARLLAWPLPVAVVLGVAATLVLLVGHGAAPGPWGHSIAGHLLSGPLVFATLFLLADPATLPHTVAGRWAMGLLAGSLTVVLRLLDPAHPDAVLHALLLATLAGPLCDQAALAVRRLRRRGPA